MKGIRKRIYISIGDFVLLFFILISFVFSPIGKIFLPFFSLIQYMIIAYTLLLSYYFFYKNKNLSNSQKWILIYAPISATFTILYNGNVNIIMASYYFPIICSVVLSQDQYLNKLVLLLKFFLIANFIAVINEMITGYHIVEVSEDVDLLGNLIYKCGIFSNPKEGGSVIAFSALIFFLRKEYFFVCLSFFLSILVGVRTSSFIIAFPFIISLVNIFKNNKCFFSIIITLIVFLLYKTLIEYIEISSRLWERLFDTFSFSDAGNASRLEFMKVHLSIWSNHFNVFDYLFGKWNYTRLIVGNGAESTWIEILINSGIITFILYLGCFILYLLRPYKYTYNNFIIATLFLCMIISGFGIGLSAILFWTAFNLIYKNKIKQ